MVDETKREIRTPIEKNVKTWLGRFAGSIRVYRFFLDFPVNDLPCLDRKPNRKDIRVTIKLHHETTPLY